MTTDNSVITGYEARLWEMADALRGSMDAAEYKHVVLGLIFLNSVYHLTLNATDGTHDGALAVADLAACAAELGVAAVYALAGGEWVSYILGAPDFVNARFRALFADGVPVATPLVVRGEER